MRDALAPDFDAKRTLERSALDEFTWMCIRKGKFCTWACDPTRVSAAVVSGG